MDELTEALNNVVDYGMAVIDSLTPEQLEQVREILERVK